MLHICLHIYHLHIAQVYIYISHACPGPLYLLPQHNSKKVKPGLSTFAADPTAAGASLQGLIDFVNAVEKRKRNLVLTLNGKSTVFMNKLFPAWADKMVNKFFIKDGKLIK
ncbi:hypothetical protein EON65_22435 [archaeon]|nr:MAG: hypothetical protein EON65_22435 [archaeon]